MVPEVSTRGLTIVPTDRGWEVSAGTARAVFRVESLAAPVPGQVGSRAWPARTVIVADRLSASVRAELLELGLSWWDKRGHLHLESRGIFVDTPVPAVAGVQGIPLNQGRPATSKVWLEVVTTLLAHPEEGLGPRELERRLGRAVSAISRVLVDLKGRALLTRAGVPLLPDLFWEAAGQWQADLVPVRARPRNGALTDSQAAAAWGAPMVGDVVPRYYVPSAADSLTQLKEASWPLAKAVVATAPVPLALEAHTRSRLAHPLVVALDLAQDLARGREVLEGWTPPDPWVRVW